jgi:plasmid maintenance system antidote protein VapI
MTKKQTAIPVDVGTIIAQLLQEKRLSQIELSKQAGCKVWLISKIVNKVRMLDSEMAMQFERIFDLPNKFLMNAQEKHRAYIKEQKDKDTIPEGKMEKKPIERMVYFDSSDFGKKIPIKENPFKIRSQEVLFAQKIRESFEDILKDSEQYHLLAIADTYAIVGKTVNLNIRKYVETMFQSVDKEINKDLFICTIFEWSKGIPQNHPLRELGIPHIVKIWDCNEIEKRLWEMGKI